MYASFIAHHKNLPISLCFSVFNIKLSLAYVTILPILFQTKNISYYVGSIFSKQTFYVICPSQKQIVILEIVLHSLICRSQTCFGFRLYLLMHNINMDVLCLYKFSVSVNSNLMLNYIPSHPGIYFFACIDMLMLESYTHKHFHRCNHSTNSV